MIPVDENHGVWFGMTRRTTIGPVVGRWPVKIHTDRIRQLVTEPTIEGHLPIGQEGRHANLVVTSRTRARQAKRVQIDKIVAKGHPSLMLVEHDEMWSAMGGKVLLGIDVHYACKYGAIHGTIVWAHEISRILLWVLDDGGRAALDLVPRLQQRLDV